MPLLDLPNGRMFFTSTGSGTPGLLFTHGSACTHADWNFVLPALADRYAVASVDLRGYGASTGPAETCNIDAFAEDVISLVHHLGWERAVLVGHSMSCRVVLQAAADHPDLVAGVVIVDATITSRSLADLESQRVARYGEDYPAGSIARFTEMLGDGVAPSERARILEHVRRVPREVAETVVMSAWDWDAQRVGEVVGRLDTPVLAIQTTTVEDSVRRSLRPDETTYGLDLLRTAKSSVRTVVMPGLGHFPMLEEPDGVAAHIATFAEQL